MWSQAVSTDMLDSLYMLKNGAAISIQFRDKRQTGGLYEWGFSEVISENTHSYKPPLCRLSLNWIEMDVKQPEKPEHNLGQPSY